jgi:hypothetical protein
MGSRLAAALLLLAAAEAAAQTRPLLTEEATTAPAGRLVLETGFEAMAEEPSYVTGVKRTRWDGPLLRFVYSPAANVELDLEWVVLVGAGEEPGREAVHDAGDVTLRAKWRILGGEGFACGARFGVTLPNTNFADASGQPLALGPDSTRVFAEALLTQPLGRARLHANAGLLIMDEVFRAHQQSDFLSYGLALAVPMGAVEAVLEVAGRAGEDEPGTDQRSEVRLGFRFGRGRVKADLAVRRGLAPADGTWGGTLGLSWAIRSGRAAAPSPPR